jgi:predicted peptidase
MEEKVFEGLTYLVSYPEGFCEDKKYSLVVYLHGRGCCIESTEKLHKTTSLAHLRERQTQRGFIVVAPHCPSGNWNEWMMHLIRFVDHTRGLPYVDETRVYMTGNSMGGYGTWEIAAIRPQWFAAILPVCGGGIGGFARRLVGIPIRTFHGLRDTVVDPIESLQMAKSVNLLGGHAELILYPELDHNCWDRVYTDEANYDWLLQFCKQEDPSSRETLSGEQYG